MIVVEIVTPVHAVVYAHSYTSEAEAREKFEEAYRVGYDGGGRSSAWLIQEAEGDRLHVVVVADTNDGLADVEWGGTPYPLTYEVAQSFMDRRQKAIAGEVGGTIIEHDGVTTVRDTIPPGTEVRITEEGEWKS